MSISSSRRVYEYGPTELDETELNEREVNERENGECLGLTVALCADETKQS